MIQSSFAAVFGNMTLKVGAVMFTMVRSENGKGKEEIGESPGIFIQDSHKDRELTCALIFQKQESIDIFRKLLDDVEKMLKEQADAERAEQAQGEGEGE